MNGQDFTTTFVVDQAPAAVFAAITNVRGWWSEDIEGRTDQLGQFTYRHRDLHRCRIEVTELRPGAAVVWRVLENYFQFTKDPAEWTGTEIRFELRSSGHQTEVRFTHIGLVPQEECYGVCSNAWSSYINGSLRALIETGRGRPNERRATEQPA
ncbi:MAG: SRPBCC domain-containing protein [Vicinamibacterales bacterium]